MQVGWTFGDWFLEGVMGFCDDGGGGDWENWQMVSEIWNSDTDEMGPSEFCSVGWNLVREYVV